SIRPSWRGVRFLRVPNHESDTFLILETRPRSRSSGRGFRAHLTALGTLTMAIADKLVLQRQHHLKWRAFDRLELILMMICGVLCFGFSLSVAADIVTRTIRHPWLLVQVVTSILCILVTFIGACACAVRLW